MTLPRSIPTGSHIGIDISKDRLDIAVHETGQAWQCAQTPVEHAALAALLAAHQVRLVLMEATGRYGHALAAALHRAGVSLRVENPVRVRHFVRSVSHGAKSDPIDARMLARMGAALKLEASAQVTDRELEMAELNTRRDQLVLMRNAERARLTPSPVSDLVRHQIEETVAHLNRQIAAVEQRCDALIDLDARLSATCKAFVNVSGVAIKTARTILACAPEIGQLNRGQIASLAGLCPITNQSGQRHAPTPIGKGRERLRRALYMAALSAKRHNSILKPISDRLAASGLKPKQVTIAVARKLLIHLNSLAAKEYQHHLAPA